MPDLLYIPKKDAIKSVALFASQICSTPIAFISIINQKDVWYKSSVGLSETEENKIKDLTYHPSKDYSKILEIEDVMNNKLFFNHPVISKKNIVYYASVPLITPNGTYIGSLGVMDRKKRKLTPKQKKALIQLSIQLLTASDHRLSKNEIEKNILVFQKKNDAIEDFTNLAVANMSSPLNTITILSDIINKNCSEELSLELTNYLKLIENSSKKMIHLINEVKDFYDNIDLIAKPKEDFLLKDLLTSVDTHGLQFTFDKSEGEKKLFANKLALKKIIESQIAISKHLIRVSAEVITVSISFEEKKDQYWFNFISNRAINKETLMKFTEEEETSFSSISQTLISALGGSKEITLTDDNKGISLFIAK